MEVGIKEVLVKASGVASGGIYRARLVEVCKPRTGAVAAEAGDAS
jgi:hypothetical protein